MVNALLNDQVKPSGARKEPAQDEKRARDVRSLPDDVAKDLVHLFKLLSDETRLRILHYLMQQEELNVRTLCELLGQSQPAVSHHLALLRVAGLIDCRRDGKHNFYRIVSGRLQQMVETMFAVTPKQAGQIRFETFWLSYWPAEH